MVFILYFYMAVIVIFFSLKFSDEYLKTGIVVLIFWTLFFLNMKATLETIDEENTKSDCKNLIVEVDENTINKHGEDGDDSCC